MRTNPEQASKWIMTNATDKNKAIHEVIHGWGWNNGKKALDFVNNQDLEHKDKAYEALVSRYSWNDSKIAIKALEKIADLEKRKHAVKNIYRSLKHRKKSSAEEFLAGRNEFAKVRKNF